MTEFRPMLAVDIKENLSAIRYPKYASYKLDGIRCIFKDGQMLSRSLKLIQNKQLQKKFEGLKEFSRKANVIIDGELYSHKHSFQDITRAVMTQDFDDPSTIARLMKELDCSEGFAESQADQLIDDMEFHCFDIIMQQEYTMPFFLRKNYLEALCTYTDVKIVEQVLVASEREVMELFDKAVADGYEGLILRDPESPYKFGRSTQKEEWMLKVKPWVTFDARITGVQQATVVDPNAEKKINELGHSVTSKKKDDRILIEKASAFIVDLNGVEQDVTIAATDPEKIEIWKNRDDYIGRMIEFKGMTIGSKDKIRHPTLVRFRDDKE